MNRILIVYGGDSVEHEISIITALQVYNAYKGKYKLDLCYLRNGNFYFSKKLKNISFYKKIKTNLKTLKPIKFIPNKKYFYHNFKKIHFEAIWIVSHGKNCEDGTIASFFKTKKIEVISESISAASVGQDKVLSKTILNDLNLKYFEVTNYSFSYELEKIIKQAQEIGLPLIVKPTTLGSSIGVNVANNTEQLIDIIEELLHLSPSVIIEEKISNFTEYNIACFEYKNELILSEIEKVNENKILSYSDKYYNDTKSMMSQTKELPAKISNELRNDIMLAAQKIYRKLKAQYIVRIDFLYDNNKNTLYFNEINNIPGALSMYLFKEKGISESQLIDMYIDEGLYQVKKESGYITNYDKNIFSEEQFNNVKLSK